MKNPLCTLKKIPDIKEIFSLLPNLKGLFFDMDGTLLNTEIIHAQALKRMAIKYRIQMPYSEERIHQLVTGKADYLIYDLIKSWEGSPAHWTADSFSEEKNLMMVEIINSIPQKTYFNEKMNFLLHGAKTEKIFLGLVTSSEYAVVDYFLETLNIKNLFDLIITRNDCSQHKPHPFPYQQALKKSGLSQEQILIFEDSAVGLQAALRSGMEVAHCQWY